MKKILITFFIASIIFIGCADAKKDPIKIGVAGPHSGDFAPYGVPTLQAVEIVADQINADGGIDGRLIELVVGDDLCDPSQSTNVASRFITEEVVAVVGHICSGATISAMGIYMSANIPVISPSATSPELTKSGKYTGFFRTIAPDDLQGVTQGIFLTESLQIARAAVIHDAQDYGKGLADSTKLYLEQSGSVEIALYESIGVGAVDYSAITSKIVNLNVDAIVFGGYHPEASRLVNQLREKGYQGAFIAGDGIKTNDFISLAGVGSEGVYTTSPKDKSGYKENQDAQKAFMDKHNETPGVFYDEGYAAFSVIIEALKAGNYTPTEIKDFLLSGKTFDTAVGSISFDNRGDAQGTGFAVYQVQNGEFQSVQ